VLRESDMDLSGMTWHWGDAYSISMENGTWTAIPLEDPDASLTANSADGLRELIRADYFRRTAKHSPLLRERMST
jgi:hypothetical protein